MLDNTLIDRYRITAVLKVETDIIASIAASPIGQLLVIMSVDTFKTDVIVFIGNVIRERPFNLKGGSYGFFLKKKYSDSQCC